MALDQANGMGAMWYVTNGDVVIGPVRTDLLLRGIVGAKVPDDAWVRQESWKEWRPLFDTRELSLLGPGRDAPYGGLGAGQQALDVLVRWAEDAGEALLFAMHAAVTALGAGAGLVHRVRLPFVGLVTSSAHGSGTGEELGQVLSWDDATVARARNGGRVLGAPHDGPAERAIARRFATLGEVRGVAMVPVFDGDRLLATIELARTDHVFRSEDAGTLLRIAELVSAR